MAHSEYIKLSVLNRFRWVSSTNNYKCWQQVEVVRLVLMKSENAVDG